MDSVIVAAVNIMCTQPLLHCVLFTFTTIFINFQVLRNRYTRSELNARRRTGRLRNETKSCMFVD